MTRVRRFLRFSAVSIVLVLLMLGIAATPSFAETYNDFTIDPQALANDPDPTSSPYPDTVVGDQFKAGYLEVFTVTAPGEFATEAFWNIPVMWANDATVALAPAITGIGDSAGYSLYALFSATGTFAVDGSGGVTFTATGGTVTLYVDRDIDTTFDLPDAAPGAVTRMNTDDDDILATATLLFGDGELEGGESNGDFGLVFVPFQLTGLGSTYFIDPIPFYMVARLGGQFNAFVPLPTGCTPDLFGTEACSSVLDGSADAFFQDQVVPEPASLTLLGLGLLGSGLSARRRQKAA